MNIFERIQHGTGLENYCTDILVGILQKDTDLLRKFCTDKEVLNLPEDSIPNDGSLKISLQESYKAITDNKIRNQIDIKISGTNFLCFLEMKVESSQNKHQDGKSQLNHYHSSLQTEIFEHKYLRFCTKYHEIVSSEDINEFEQLGKVENYFHQFRWYNIHDFFKVFCQDNTLIKEFLQFLEMNMMSDKELIYTENEALSFYDNLKMFNDILKDLKSSLSSSELGIIKNCFEIKTTPTLNFRHKRFGYSFKPYKNEISFEYYTGVFIGFEFTKEGILCKLDFWSKSSNSEITKFNFRTYIKTNDNETIRERYYPNTGIVTYKKLKNSGLKISDIRKWFTEELENIQEHK